MTWRTLVQKLDRYGLASDADAGGSSPPFNISDVTGLESQLIAVPLIGTLTEDQELAEYDTEVVLEPLAGCEVEVGGDTELRYEVRGLWAVTDAGVASPFVGFEGPTDAVFHWTLGDNAVPIDDYLGNLNGINDTEGISSHAASPYVTVFIGLLKTAAGEPGTFRCVAGNDDGGAAVFDAFTHMIVQPLKRAVP